LAHSQRLEAWLARANGDAQLPLLLDHEVIEMPSIAESFYRGVLDASPERVAIYEALGDLMDEKIRTIDEKLSSNAGQNEAAASMGAADELSRSRLNELKGAYLVQRVLYYCYAGKPEQAAAIYASAETYDYLRQRNAWDRLAQLGKELFEIAAKVPDVGMDEYRGYPAAVIYAGALIESNRMEEAKEWCRRTREHAWDRSPYWWARLRLLDGRRLRYQGEAREAIAAYDEAIQRLTELIDEVADDDDAQIAEKRLWIARAFARKSQCLMSLGELKPASACLENAGKHLAGAAPSPSLLAEQDKVQGLLDRNEITILMLEGRLDAAEKALRRLESRKGTPGRIRAVLVFKRGRLLLERARELELQQGHPVVGGVSPPPLSSVLRQAQRELQEAEKLSRLYSPGDRRWLSAISLARTEAFLLGRRSSEPGVVDVSALDKEIGRLERRLSAAGRDVPNVRGMGAEVLRRGCAYQQALERILAGQEAPDGLIGALRHGLTSGTPYQILRDLYERAYYLWRVWQSLTPGGSPALTSAEMEAKIVELYGSATALLYGSDFSASGLPFHNLIVAAFHGRRTRLQEQLEAAVWLQWRGRGRPVRTILDQIAREALQFQERGRDDFFTIPSKVFFRLLRDNETEAKIAKRHCQLRRAPRATVRRMEIGDVAAVLQTACREWLAAVTTDPDRYWAIAGTGLQHAADRSQFEADIGQMQRFWDDVDAIVRD
jgi:hypothetical protein